MSIKVMSNVWDHSRQKGSNLLVLLALADFANDNGFCWPSIATIARKSRLSDRQVIRIIASIEEDGELSVEHNRNTGNRYTIKWLPVSDKMSCDTDVTFEVTKQDDITDIATSHDPSLIRKEPSVPAHSESARPPADLEELEYADLDEAEDAKRPKWQIPETPDQRDFLAPCKAKWFSSGQKSKVKAILKAYTAGDVLGDRIYEECVRSLEKAEELTTANLPPLPRSWHEWRAKQAARHRWSVDGFIDALLNRDALMKHCLMHLEKKPAGKMEDGVYIIEIPEGGPR